VILAKCSLVYGLLLALGELNGIWHFFWMRRHIQYINTHPHDSTSVSASHIESCFFELLVKYYQPNKRG